MAEKTIGISQTLHARLDEMKHSSQNYEDVIRDLLSIRKCPECGDGELKLRRSYMFEPLFFDLKCDSCGHVVQRWKVPFNGGEK